MVQRVTKKDLLDDMGTLNGNFETNKTNMLKMSVMLYY